MIVHCQAGVGRTGTFLAVFLMEKYLCSAQDALDKLRHIRPQSLQYDRFDWQSTPFAFSPPGHYNRNYLQERFLEVYHTLRIAERDQQLQQSTSPKLSIMQRSVQQKNGLSMSLFSSLDTEDRWEIVFGDYSETDVLSSMVGRAIGQSLLIIVDLEIEDKLLFFKEHPHTLFDIQSQILPECYICERILSVGPFLTHRGMSQFPPTEASAAFGCPSLSSLNNSENIDPNEISFESSAGMTSAEVVQLFEELTLQTPLTLVSQGVTPFNSPATPVETLNLIKVTESPLTSVDI